MSNEPSMLDLRVSTLPRPGLGDSLAGSRRPRRAQHYRKLAPQGRTDVEGARMWGVALDKVMLTYFCVRPNTRWETHRHESEQITLVLKGELFFDVGDDVISVKQGEAIAIPSNLPHAAYTGGGCVEAVDAWSPVMASTRDSL